MTHASVFSGIGGAEIAATMLGWQNLFHCEINPYGRRVLQYWYPKAKSYEDITQTDFTEWKGKIDVLSGGFPCQPFSLAGKRGGADDDRYLWPYMYKCIEQVQPHWIIAENVAGILSMVEQGTVSTLGGETDIFSASDDIHRFRLQQTYTIERISNNLESKGYEVQSVLIPACAVGAPHRRDRVFIIAHANRAESEGMRQNRQNALYQHDFTADTECWRGFKVEKSIRLQLANGAELERARSEWPFAYTEGKRSERMQSEQSENGESAQIEFGGRGCEDGSISGCGRWKYKEQLGWLPTQPPVHRRNDGISFDVDCLTIPFRKWRTEALKAYGNAIVPQVIYEIFKAIEQVEIMPK